MSKPNQSSFPTELQDALAQKSPQEQERLQQVWQLLGHLEGEDLDVSALDIPTTEEALADLEATLDVDPKTTTVKSFAKDRPANRRNMYRESRGMQWITAAASISVALFAVMIWVWRVPVVVNAPLGEQVSVVLPDHSVVTLNSGSRLEYARRFESWPLIATAKRRVFLQGEAFFEVEKQTKPFVVETFNAQVRVLGTSFNVWAREHDAAPETRVALNSGEVLVTHHDAIDEDVTFESDLTTILDVPGQTVRVVTDNQGQTENFAGSVPTDQISAWRSHGLSAIEFSIASIVAEIERQYAIDIELDNAIDASRKMTFYIQEKPSVEALIENICLSIGCQYRPTNTGFHIFPTTN